MRSSKGRKLEHERGVARARTVKRRRRVAGVRDAEDVPGVKAGMGGAREPAGNRAEVKGEERKQEEERE